MNKKEQKNVLHLYFLCCHVEKKVYLLVFLLGICGHILFEEAADNGVDCDLKQR